MALCSATTKTGRPCRAQALAGGAFCLMHDPERAAEVAAIRRAGGLNRRTRRAAGTRYPATLRSVRDVQELLEAALADTMQQENSGARTQALVRLAHGALKVLELGSLEERIAALEARAGLRRAPQEAEAEADTEEVAADAQSEAGAA